MITKKELLERRRQKMYEELSVRYPNIKDNTIPEFETLAANKLIDAIVNDIISYEAERFDKVKFQYSYTMVDWIKDLEIEVFYLESNIFSGHTSITNTKKENDRISGIITVNIKRLETYSDDKVSIIKGIIRHELLHLYQYYSWSSFSDDLGKDPKKEASRFGYDEEFKKYLLEQGKIKEFSDGIPIFSEKTQEREKAAYYINYLGYYLNPLEIPAFIQSTYEGLYKETRNQTKTSIYSLIRNFIEKELEPLKQAIIFLSEFILSTKFYSEVQKNELEDFLFDPSVCNHTIMNNLRLKPSQDYLNKLLNIFRKRYKTYKVKIDKLFDLVLDEVKIIKTQKSLKENIETVYFCNGLIGIESMSPSAFHKEYPELDEKLQIEIDSKIESSRKKILTLEDIKQVYKNVYGDEWEDYFYNKNGKKISHIEFF
jgi:hypothetical protein